jgi:hypothetical protein
MGDSFSIKSSCSDRELVFLSHEGDYFNIAICGNEISAIRRIWGYTDCELLVDLFHYLAKQEHAWESPADWSSIESDFGLHFTCNKQGHVFVTVELRNFIDSENWMINAVIQTELGLLPNIANSASIFFNV